MVARGHLSPDTAKREPTQRPLREKSARVSGSRERSKRCHAPFRSDEAESREGEPTLITW